jgi:phosphoglycolate phosphatase
MTARIVFDLDGTLIDSAPDIMTGANGILAARGAAPLTLEETKRFIGSGAAVFVTRMREARGLPDSEHDRLLAAFNAGYAGFVGQTAPYPGVPEALAALRARGHRLGLCTNKPVHATRAVLDDLDLAAWFGTIRGGDSLPMRKPDPAPLLSALRAMGDGPAIFVGDSEVDAETAAGAGTPFLLFTEGYRQAPVAALQHRAAFGAFAELPELVAAILRAA